MIVVHHLKLSRSQRVVWLLEELGIPYELKAYQRDERTLFAPPELRAVHPLGKSPVITDGALTLAESGAILEYLVEREGSHLAPAPGTPQRAGYLYWMHYAEGSLMPPLLMKLMFDRVARMKGPLLIRPVVRRTAAQALESFVLPQIRQHLEYIEGALGERDWFAGEVFSAADIQMTYPIEAAQIRVGLRGLPKLGEWLERIQARPAYRRAAERAGGFGVPNFPD